MERDLEIKLGRRIRLTDASLLGTSRMMGTSFVNACVGVHRRVVWAPVKPAGPDDWCELRLGSGVPAEAGCIRERDDLVRLGAAERATVMPRILGNCKDASGCSLSCAEAERRPGCDSTAVPE